MQFKRILITGGAGYVGQLLTEHLLDKGYFVCVYDLCFFGTGNLVNIKSANFKILNKDIRDQKSFDEATRDIDVVIHLACISNDPSFELDKNLSKTINFDCFEDLVKISKKNGVKRFVYCSSSSVYGISNKKNVTEEHELVPLTLYNKYKALCEPILFNYTDSNFEGVVIRPATLCGYSPRMRFDLTVNILTSHALVSNKINVFGGSQLRPNLNIKDMISLYELMIESKSIKIQNQIFNVGYQNKSVREIANIVKTVVSNNINLDKEIEISYVETNDNRSYHINSDKIKNVLDFSPKFTIEDAVVDICVKFQEKKFKDIINNSNYYNVKKILKLNKS